MTIGLLVVGTAFVSAHTASANSPNGIEPAYAYDYEYMFSYDPNTGVSYSTANDLPYSNPTCSSSSTIYKIGYFSAENGYSGVVLDMGDPVGFFYLRQYDSTSAPYFFGSSPATSGVASWLSDMENCINQGYSAYLPGLTEEIYLSFSNETSNYTTAGDYAGYWDQSGGTKVFGAWVDYEGQWSTEANAWTEEQAYHSYKPYDLWYDAGWRSGDWTYSQMMSYINGVDSNFYSGSADPFLTPENYYANMNNCSDYPIDQSSSNCTENPWIGSYVTGVTEEEGTPYTIQQQWDNYVTQPYPNLNSGELVMVGAYANNVTYSVWSAL